MLNYRQSGHPGGSRSKVPAFISLLLGGAMRWDIRSPENVLGDRFALGAGHTVPMVYATLTVLNEAMRQRYLRTGNKRYNPGPDEKVLYWNHLTGFRRKGGLSGHAEMEGRTLFLRFNTGPSGRGFAAAAGQAVALKRAGAEDTRVFVMEGEGGLTTGVTHEVLNSAWGLSLNNLHVLVDWNDFGIDGHRTSDIVFGDPQTWFESHGWKAFGTDSGEQWAELDTTLDSLVSESLEPGVPRGMWFRTRKGRGYNKYDNASHGSPHKINSNEFWETKKGFMERCGVEFVNFGRPAPENRKALEAEFQANLKVVSEVLSRDEDLVDYLSDRLVEIGDSLQERSVRSEFTNDRSPFEDTVLYEFRNYPESLYRKPGARVPNRKALHDWGAWINAYGREKFNRPLFMVSSADLSESTNIAGFSSEYGNFPGYGWYNRVGSSEGVLLPQGITEFANAGIMTGLASVNFSASPEKHFNGFWGATSTYGSFSYLAYGMLRLYSQMDQDCDLALGKVVFVAGHSGPETADDSRTHFGIHAPGVSQLVPEGRIINLYPWEYNEVPVLLASALKLADPSIIVLHLTRPPITIPDRKALGIPSHFEAARGAYTVRDYRNDRERDGTFYVQGTSAMANILNLLPALEEDGLNCKFVYVSSPQLFSRQSEDYKRSITDGFDTENSTLILTSARHSLPEFSFRRDNLEYALSPDWDNRWRTGGTLDEILEEAGLSEEAIRKGIWRFADRIRKRNR